MVYQKKSLYDTDFDAKARPDSPVGSIGNIVSTPYKPIEMNRSSEGQVLRQESINQHKFKWRKGSIANLLDPRLRALCILTLREEEEEVH